MLFIVNSKLLTDMLSVIGKCPPQCLASQLMSIICYRKNKDFHISWIFFVLAKCGWSSDFCTSKEIKSQRGGKNSCKSMSEQLWVFVKCVSAKKGLVYLNRWTIRYMKILTAKFTLLFLKLLENQSQSSRWE